MNRRSLTRTAMGVCGVALALASNGMAADKAAKKAASDPKAMQAMMAEAMKRGSPNENHKVLESFIGKWNFAIKSWMNPGDKAMESTGNSENTWVLGGRFMRQEAHGSWNGQPFEGLGFTGYDNVGGYYTTIWMDNMSTGMMKGQATFNAASKTLMEAGDFNCPMTGQKALSYRSEWKVVDADNFTYAWYMKGPDDKEFKSMEITYKRAK